MTEPTKVVAIIAASPALSSILAMVVAGDTGLRVRQFDSEAALHTYMRVAPIDVLVCDFDSEEAPADRLVYALRRDESISNADFAAVALTRTITAEMRHTSIRSGIDEVIVKPMSPRHLLARVQARLRTQRALVTGENGYRGPDRRDRISFGVTPVQHQRRYTDNVVALFPDRRAAPKHPGLNS
ncbi:hypothetical protein [Devosia sp.]|uniref:hypothetical protein n=1 Tax=Devosia sp. TaxID=1871048 RepID=UPI00326711F9